MKNIDLQQFLTRARYKYEIADFLKISRSTLNDYCKFYNIDWKKMRRIPIFEIEKFLKKIGYEEN